jgi:hypothetical protein
MWWADLAHMSMTAPYETMTLAEVQQEMAELLDRSDRRGGFHPAEYWRWKDLAAIEKFLLAGAVRR